MFTGDVIEMFVEGEMEEHIVLTGIGFTGVSEASTNGSGVVEVHVLGTCLVLVVSLLRGDDVRPLIMYIKLSVNRYYVVMVLL